MREALRNGVRVPFTPEEEAARDAEEAEWARPKTQAEKDTVMDRRAQAFAKSDYARVLRAVADLADPTMNDAKFRALVRAALKT